jgi:enoyl-CoA hydratase/carnithine racemase
METLTIADDGAVRTITLNRPEKRNALTAEMLRGLEATFSEPPAADARVVVVRSAGPVFCAGLDLHERLEEGAQGSASPIEAMLHKIETYPLPVVAVVQGAAIAGGNELALHCDIVLASTEATFGMSLAQIGLAPSWFLAKKLLEVGGPMATKEILLLGEPLPAQRMYDLGLITRVAAPQRIAKTADEVVDRLARNAPLSLRAMKALITREMAFREGIPHDDIDRLVAATRGSEDAREGIAARLARRRPEFTGR